MEISLRTFTISITYPYLIMASKFEVVNASKLDKIDFQIDINKLRNSIVLH